MSYRESTARKIPAKETTEINYVANFIDKCKDFSAAFSIDDFERTIFETIEQKLLTATTETANRELWHLNAGQLPKEAISTYCEVILTKVSSGEINSFAVQKIISFLTSLPPHFSSLSQRYLKEFAITFTQSNQSNQANEVFEVILSQTLGISTGTTTELELINRYSTWSSNQAELLKTLEELLQHKAKDALKTHLPRIEQHVELYAQQPALATNAHLVLFKIQTFLDNQPAADMYLTACMQSANALMADSYYFIPEQVEELLPLIQTLIKLGRHDDAKPYLHFVTASLKNRIHSLKAGDTIDLAALSQQFPDTPEIDSPQSYLEKAHSDLIRERGMGERYREKLNPLISALMNLNYTEFAEKVLLEEKTYFDDLLDFMPGEQGEDNRMNLYPKYGLLIKIATIYGFSGLTRELTKSLFHHARNDREQTAFGEFYDRMQEVLLAIKSPASLDYLQTAACFSDDHLKKIGLNYRNFHSVVENITENEPENSVKRVQLAALLQPSSPDVHNFCEMKVMAGDHTYLPQLAFVRDKVPPLYTEFWMETQLLPRNLGSASDVDTALKFLHKMISDQHYRLTYFAQPNLQEVVLRLTSNENRVLRDRKTLFYLSQRSLESLDRILHSETLLRRKLAVTNFLRHLLNEAPASSLEGALWCIAETYPTNLDSETNVEQSTVIDWTKKEEQELLRDALVRLGGVTPKIYESYRSIQLPTVPKIKALEGKSKMYKALLEETSGKPEKKEKYPKLINEIEVEIAELKLPIEKFVETLQKIRQEMHQNIPLGTHWQEIADMLTTTMNSGEAVTLGPDILVELIFLLYSPIGFSYENIKELLGDSDDGLLSIEDETVQQVSESGILWSKSDTVNEAGFVWNKTDNCYQSTLVFQPKVLSIDQDQEAFFNTQRQKIAGSLKNLHPDFLKFLRSNDRSLEKLLLSLINGQTNHQNLTQLRNESIITLETFGIWFVDNEKTLSQEHKLSEVEVYQLRSNLADISQELQHLLAHFKEADDPTKEREEKSINFYLSKNVASFFAKASVGLCTAEDVQLFLRPDHLHLNGADEQTKEVMSNLQVYVVNSKMLPESNRSHDRFILVRGFNPGEKHITAENAEAWFQLLLAASRLLGKLSNLPVHLCESTRFHPHTNRPTMDVEMQQYYAKTAPIKLTKPFKITSDATIQRVYPIT